MGVKEHGTGENPGPSRQQTNAPRHQRALEESLRSRRATLLLKAVTAGKATQGYFEQALKAHELDTLNLLTQE